MDGVAALAFLHSASRHTLFTKSVLYRTLPKTAIVIEWRHKKPRSCLICLPAEIRRCAMKSRILPFGLVGDRLSSTRKSAVSRSHVLDESNRCIIDVIVVEAT